MLTLSPRERRFVDEAVGNALGPARRDAWRSWLGATGVPGSRDVENVVLPRDVTETALLALRITAAAIVIRLRAGGIAEDEAADLENDLGFIASIESAAAQALAEGVVYAAE